MIMESGPMFGRVLTAMATPFAKDGSLDLKAAAELAAYLVDEQHNDGLVISGTGGEAPTTTDQEKADLLAAVIDAVGDRAAVIAGVGTYDTRHTIELLAAAERAGADGGLVVTPFYSMPDQDALRQHFTAVADSSGLPLVLYDIPHRTGRPIEIETLLALAEHPRIVGVKDAKKDLPASAQVIAATDLLYYAGDDSMTLPLLAIGGVGVVGTSTHFTGTGTRQLVDAYLDGKVDEALRLHQQLLPTYIGIFRAQGCTMVKAGLELRGRPIGVPRLPQRVATAEEKAALERDFAASGL